jgi:hypothetical protein
MNTTPHPRFAHLLPAARGEGSRRTLPASAPRPAQRGEGARRAGEGLVRIAGIVILLLAFASIASACPVCYGTAQTPLTKGASNGVLFLLGIVGSVQVGFVALFVTFWKRAKALAQKREQFHIIDGGKER